MRSGKWGSTLIKVTALMLACIYLFGGSSAKAASATIDIETDNEEVTVDDLIEVDLVLKSTSRLGGFEGYLSYNSKTLEFQSADDGIAGGDGLLRIFDMEPSLRSKERTYRIIFKAVNAGGSEIAFKDSVYVYDDETDDELSVSSSSLSIRVVAAKEASGECRLSGLVISPGKLVPEFSSDVFEYKTEVGADTKSLVVSANPMDSASKVTLTGNEEFTTGSNKVIITVKAENSEEKTYTIVVNKLEEKLEEEEDIDLTEILSNEFSVIGEGKNFILTGRYNYTVSSVPDIKLVPEGYDSYTLELYGKRIPAYKKENEADPDTVLLYVISGESGDFYEFSIKNKTMDRIRFQTVEKEVTPKTKPEKKDILPKADNTVLYGIIIVLFIIAALLGLALLNTAGNNKKKRSGGSRSGGSRSGSSRSGSRK